MENPRAQLLAQIQQATNVLVTVSADPSVDQLAAAIGLTLLLNKLDKHATAVYSGETPSTIEFLEPEKTLEKNTDSLRDFIIALDKAKADKLRYKVEDKMVKIFITPYRTSISDADLEFSQGDFNVDLVVALGVQKREDLDQAIVSHGRILHDAAVASVNTTGNTEVGTINWLDNQASSLCEMLVTLVDELKVELDGQMATALLTGIVSETHRFSNEKTSSNTMALSAKLMSAGANQQLVATKLQEKPTKPKLPKDTFDDKRMDELAKEPADNETDQGSSEKGSQDKATDGALAIDHGEADNPAFTDSLQDELNEKLSQIHIDEHGNVMPKDEAKSPDAAPTDGPKFIDQPPRLGGTLTANSQAEQPSPSTDPMSLPPVDTPLLNHSDGPMPATDSATPTADTSQDMLPPTLHDLEASVASPHLENPGDASTEDSSSVESAPAAATQHLESARDAVSQAIAEPPASESAIPPAFDLPGPAGLDSVVASAAPLPNLEPFNPNEPPINPSATDLGIPPLSPVPVSENSPTPDYAIPMPPMDKAPLPDTPFTMPTYAFPSAPLGADQPATGDGGVPPPIVPPPMMPPSFGESTPGQSDDDQQPLVPPVL